jgi:hypothetical protein
MQPTTNRPYFLWDYNLSNADVRRILHGENETEKIWMMSRILESARYEDVWKYMTLAELRQTFPKLQLKPQVRDVWAFALEVWEREDTK